jgi:hypothetical protein
MTNLYANIAINRLFVTRVCRKCLAGVITNKASFSQLGKRGWIVVKSSLDSGKRKGVLSNASFSSLLGQIQACRRPVR